MKKTLSLVMIVAMLLSCVAFAVPASAKATAENIDYVEALYFEKAPTIDGYISEAEWGEATVYVESYDCATVDDKDPYYNFFYNRVSATNRDDYGQFEYYIWLRWDLNRFYLGVKVTDPDVHCLKNGTTNTWNGDAIQTRIDKSGANGAVNGETFTVTADRQKPWSSTTVPDFLFGYVEIAGGFSEAWENTQNKGMTSFSNNPLGTAQCVVAPAGSNYSPDTQAGITTYEVSIPWAYIYNGQYESLEMKNYAAGRDSAKQGPRGAIGKEFGMSLVVLNDGADATAGWDAFMSWGSGICNAQQEEGAKVCTGSNSVTLVETPVLQAATYTTYDPTALLDAKFNTESVDPVDVYYDYLAGDIYKENKVSYDQLSSLTYDDPSDLSVWGAPEYGGKIGKAADSAHGNVLDYTSDPAEDNLQTYIDTRDGVVEYLFPTSYTFEFDIMYTKTNQAAEGYEPALYNWFGGVSTVAYQCGYFFNDGQFKIVNANDPLDVLATYDGFDLKPNTWYNWKFQFDNDSCNARLWVDDLSTEKDNILSGVEGVPGFTGRWGTLVFNANNRYFYYSSEKALDPDQGTLLIFRQMNTQIAYDNVKIYNFAAVSECDHLVVYKETVMPTCTKDGYTGIKCSDCGAFVSKTKYPAKGHSENVIEDTLPTCTESGRYYSVCSECDHILADYYYAPLGHEFVESIMPPTYYMDGESVTVCARCDLIFGTAVIPQLTTELIVYCVDEEGNVIYTETRADIYLDYGAAVLVPEIEGYSVVPDEENADGIIQVILKEQPVNILEIKYTRDFVPGDVNGDGVVNSVDSNLMRRFISGTITSIIEKNADMNGDGVVSSIDSNLIIRTIAGA